MCDARRVHRRRDGVGGDPGHGRIVYHARGRDAPMMLELGFGRNRCASDAHGFVTFGLRPVHDGQRRDLALPVEGQAAPRGRAVAG